MAPQHYKDYFQATGIDELENNSFSNWVRGGEDGWLYPPQARVLKVSHSEFGVNYAVIDETGWDGYEEVPPIFVEWFEDESDAWDKASEIVN